MAMDFALALRAMDGDQKLLEQLAIIFSEDAPVIAAEFGKSIGAQDSKSARMAIHSLKGLAASFFDKSAVEKFAAIEQCCVDENWRALEDSPGEVCSSIEALIADMHGLELLAKSPT